MRKIKVLLQILLPIALLIWTNQLNDSRGLLPGETIQPKWVTSDVATQVALGGDRIQVTYRDDNHTRSSQGTVCFYVPSGKAVAYAHNAFVPAGELEIRVSYHTGALPEADITALTRAGVVFSDIPVPESRQVLTLGGTDSVTVGAHATVHPYNRDPYEVRVRGYVEFRSMQFLVLEPLSSAGRIYSGMSGTPILQNGKIIAFVSSSYANNPAFLALLASDLWATLGEHLGEVKQ